MNNYPLLLSFISAAQTGDIAATEWVLGAMLPIIKARTQRFKIPGYEPEDLWQESRLQILEKLSGFIAASGSFYAYCSRLITNRMIDIARRVASHIESLPLEFADEAECPLPRTDTRVLSQALTDEIFSKARDDIEISILVAEQNGTPLSKLAGMVSMSRGNLSRVKTELYARIRREVNDY